MLKPFTIHSALISDMGLIRRHNEDAHYCNGSFCALEDMDRHVEHYEELTADKALFAICDGMGGQQQAVIGIFTAQIGDHTALGGDECGEAQGFEGFFYPLGSLGGVAAGGIDGQECIGLLPGEIGISLIDHNGLLIK